MQEAHVWKRAYTCVCVRLDWGSQCKVELGVWFETGIEITVVVIPIADLGQGSHDDFSNNDSKNNLACPTLGLVHRHFGKDDKHEAAAFRIDP